MHKSKWRTLVPGIQCVVCMPLWLEFWSFCSLMKGVQHRMCALKKAESTTFIVLCACLYGCLVCHRQNVCNSWEWKSSDLLCWECVPGVCFGCYRTSNGQEVKLWAWTIVAILRPLFWRLSRKWKFTQPAANVGSFRSLFSIGKAAVLTALEGWMGMHGIFDWRSFRVMTCEMNGPFAFGSSKIRGALVFDVSYCLYEQRRSSENGLEI